MDPFIFILVEVEYLGREEKPADLQADSDERNISSRMHVRRFGQ